MRRRRVSTHESARSPRPPRRIHTEVPGKLREIARCDGCGASYRNGRWTWETAPADAYAFTCPACQRIRSDYPAAILEARGHFAAEHREELVSLLRNVAESESTEHPLNRIMSIDAEDEGFVVTTTDSRLAQSLGRALSSAYGGALELPQPTAEQNELVRVRWARD